MWDSSALGYTEPPPRRAYLRLRVLGLGGFTVYGCGVEGLGGLGGAR